MKNFKVRKNHVLEILQFFWTLFKTVFLQFAIISGGFIIGVMLFESLLVQAGQVKSYGSSVVIDTLLHPDTYEPVVLIVIVIIAVKSVQNIVERGY